MASLSRVGILIVWINHGSSDGAICGAVVGPGGAARLPRQVQVSKIRPTLISRGNTTILTEEGPAPLLRDVVDH
jgi:hypothetical protein